MHRITKVYLCGYDLRNAILRNQSTDGLETLCLALSTRVLPNCLISGRPGPFVTLYPPVS